MFRHLLLPTLFIFRAKITLIVTHPKVQLAFILCLLFANDLVAERPTSLNKNPYFGRLFYCSIVLKTTEVRLEK